MNIIVGNILGPSNVDVDGLDRLIHKILSSINGDVKVPYDAFWNIPFPDRYNTGVIPANVPKPTSRDLHEYCASINDLVKAVKNNQPVPIYGLTRIGPMLTAIGEQFPTAQHVKAAAKQVQPIWAMREDELLRLLGMASLGTESTKEAIGSMKMLMSAAKTENVTSATGILDDGLWKRGRELFDSMWAGFKGIVCTIYRDKVTVEGKELAAYLAAAVAAATGIANPLAALVITIAVKRGLDKLCGT